MFGKRNWKYGKVLKSRSNYSFKQREKNLNIRCEVLRERDSNRYLYRNELDGFVEDMYMFDFEQPDLNYNTNKYNYLSPGDFIKDIRMKDFEFQELYYHTFEEVESHDVADLKEWRLQNVEFLENFFSDKYKRPNYLDIKDLQNKYNQESVKAYKKLHEEYKIYHEMQANQTPLKIYNLRKRNTAMGKKEIEKLLDDANLSADNINKFRENENIESAENLDIFTVNEAFTVKGCQQEDSPKFIENVKKLAENNIFETKERYTKNSAISNKIDTNIIQEKENISQSTLDLAYDGNDLNVRNIEARNSCQNSSNVPSNTLIPSCEVNRGMSDLNIHVPEELTAKKPVINFNDFTDERNLSYNVEEGLDKTGFGNYYREIQIYVNNEKDIDEKYENTESDDLSSIDTADLDKNESLSCDKRKDAFLTNALDSDGSNDQIDYSYNELDKINYLKTLEFNLESKIPGHVLYPITLNQKIRNNLYEKFECTCYKPYIGFSTSMLYKRLPELKTMNQITRLNEEDYVYINNRYDINMDLTYNNVFMPKISSLEENIIKRKMVTTDNNGIAKLVHIFDNFYKVKRVKKN